MNEEVDYGPEFSAAYDVSRATGASLGNAWNAGICAALHAGFYDLAFAAAYQDARDEFWYEWEKWDEVSGSTLSEPSEFEVHQCAFNTACDRIARLRSNSAIGAESEKGG